VNSFLIYKAVEQETSQNNVQNTTLPETSSTDTIMDVGEDQRSSLQSSSPTTPQTSLKMDADVEAASQIATAAKVFAKKTTPTTTYNSSSVGSKYTKQVAVQSFYYILGFVIVFQASGIVFIMRLCMDETEEIPGYFVALAIHSFCLPLLGFFNALVYFRPRYYKWRTAIPDQTRWYALSKTLFTVESPISEKRRRTLASRGVSSRQSRTIDP